MKCAWIYDEQTRIPTALEAVDDLSSRFLATNRFDTLGRQIEGRGDSRYHAMLSLEYHDGWHLILEDMGSKNGTYVVRTTNKNTFFLVLEHRGSQDSETWAHRLGARPDSASLHRRVEMKRGDVIRLCGSCFEII